jgi:dipeptidyl-peptidase-4
MKKYRFIVLASILAISTCSLFAQGQRITLEDLFRKGTFNAKSVRGITSMNDGASYLAFEKGERIVKYSYKTGEELSILFDVKEHELKALEDLSGYSISPNEERILLETESEAIYRHSFVATYFVYDISTKKITPLSSEGKQQLATFSPNGNSVAFVRGNNIFIKSLITNEEKQITFDGEFNHTINGAADWVYEEEFALTTGMQWSPDGRRLAYYRFDESRVKTFGMATYNNKLYPENYEFKYPKAGEENSIVSVHVFDLQSGLTQKMDVGEETDQYIARIKWTKNAEKLSLVRLNRLQNKIDILIADAATGVSSVLFSEVNKYFIEEPNDNYPTFTDDGKYFIVPSERDGFEHLYLYNMSGKLVTQLTKGTNEVKELYGVDSKRKMVYYQAIDDNPVRTAVFAVGFDGKKPQKISPISGSNAADFSSTFDYYIHFSSSINQLPKVTLHDRSGKLVRTLEDNSKLKELVKGFAMPQKEFFSFKTSENVELYGYMVKPLNFDATKKYPVLMYQYSGPGSQSVTDRWRIGWDEYLATEGYLVVCVDGRGTGGRGEAFKKITYGQLGYYETIDQIEAAKYLQTLPYVSAERIGIWGWSYGGYMSSLCLFKGADVFSMAIAVAPVTNWRYYDSIYTERFMGLPQTNPAGYDDNSPINHVEKMKGKLLLVHGTGDDNVHVQNSVELAEKLIQAEKQFTMMFYPDKNHGIYGGNTRMHLYTLLSNYVRENL